MASPRPTLHLASISNERFFPGLALAFASALNAASGDYDYHLHVIDDGIPAERLPPIQNAWDTIAKQRGIQLQTSLLNFDATVFTSIPAYRDSFTTYVKVLLPDLFPNLDAIRFIDADILCFAGVEALNGEGTGAPIAGIADGVVGPGGDPLIDTKLSAVEKRHPYMNAGAFWMDLKQLRESGKFDHVLELARTHQPKCHDQTLLNHLCRGRIAFLPDSLNFLLIRQANRRIIHEWQESNLHYIGPNKPWTFDALTADYFAHTLWHRAAHALLPGLLPEAKPLPLPRPSDLQKSRLKTLLYALTNPRRALWYYRSLHATLHYAEYQNGRPSLLDDPDLAKAPPNVQLPPDGTL